MYMDTPKTIRIPSSRLSVFAFKLPFRPFAREMLKNPRSSTCSR
jgi:hypothetical protein